MEREERLVLFSPQVETFTPFAGNNDASRLNMTAKQLTQCVISTKTDTPIAIDKYFQSFTGLNSPFAEYAVEDGHILLSNNETLVIYYPGIKKMMTKSTPPSKKMINNSMSLKYKAGVGPIKGGELLFDYTNMDPKTFMPRIGYRTKMMFSSFFGYTADDALAISESYAKRTEIEYSQKIFIPITKEWKYLRNTLDNFFYMIGETLFEEDYSSYFTIDASSHFMAEIHNISEQQSMFFTKKIPGIKEGIVTSVKVHRNTDKSFQELKDEYLYTPGLIEEVEHMYQENYANYLEAKHIFLQLGINEEEAVKLAEELFQDHYSVPKFTKNFDDKLRDDFHLDGENVDFMLEVIVEKTTQTTRGDKFTNLFAGKGTVSIIIPDEIMPKDPLTGEPVDMVFNPLGIFGRNNWGTIFELGLSKIVEDIELLAATINKDFDLDIAHSILERIAFVMDNFVSKYDEEYYVESMKVIAHLEAEYKHGDATPIKAFIRDIQEKGFYLYVPNFPEITYNEFYTNFLAPYGEEFKINFGKSEVHISDELIRWLRENWNYKNNVLDDDIYSIDIDAFVGSNYLLKLYHSSYSKYTAVSLASSYSKITGQPARGRKKAGGQHVSWQTLAALLGHREENGMLKEIYSIKSDAPLKEKEKFLMSYITTGEYNLKPRYVSLTKNAVDNALKVLGMSFEKATYE